MKKFAKVIILTVLSIFALFIAFTLLNVINYALLQKYVQSFEKVEYENQLTPTRSEEETFFVTDNDFKILQITDVHITGGILFAKTDKKALKTVASMIAVEKPDLVIVTGDISFAGPYAGSINNSRSHEIFISLLERLGVYYTVTFGNHDSEAYNFYNRQKICDFYKAENLNYSLFSNDDGDVYGECNHVITVKNSLGLITQSLIMLDSNSYTNNDYIGIMAQYDKIHEDQISWYERVVLSQKQKNQVIYDGLTPEQKQNNSSKVNSLAFFHIPPTEMRTAYAEYESNGNANTPNVTYISGKKSEKECPPVIEDEFFEKALELGSTKAMFFGHDHLNNHVLNYKGIVLSYGYSIDYSAYPGISRKTSQRGATVITVKPNGDFVAIHENYHQDKYLNA